jgi:hypothetical protein
VLAAGNRHECLERCVRVCAFLFELPLHELRAAPGPGGDVSYTDYPEHALAVYHSLAGGDG